MGRNLHTNRSTQRRDRLRRRSGGIAVEIFPSLRRNPRRVRCSRRHLSRSRMPCHGIDVAPRSSMPQTLNPVRPYPEEYESDVVLRDGSTLRLRPVRPDDAHKLRTLHDRLSAESRRFRFFGVGRGSEDEVSRLLRADHDNEFALVAEAADRLVGVATYSRLEGAPHRADVAFAIADPLQG